MTNLILRRKRSRMDFWGPWPEIRRFQGANSKQVTVASKCVSRNDSFCSGVVFLAYLYAYKSVFRFGRVSLSGWRSPGTSILRSDPNCEPWDPERARAGEAARAARRPSPRSAENSRCSPGPGSFGLFKLGRRQGQRAANGTEPAGPTANGTEPANGRRYGTSQRQTVRNQPGQRQTVRTQPTANGTAVSYTHLTLPTIPLV